MDGDSVQIKTFKGASAKASIIVTTLGCRSLLTLGGGAQGLNNPKSIKQVSKELLPILNGLMVPPPYAYQSSSSAKRSVMLVFGNVRLFRHYAVTDFSDAPIG